MSKLSHFEDHYLIHGDHSLLESLSIFLASMKFDGKMSFYIGKDKTGIYITDRSFVNKIPNNRRLCYSVNDIKNNFGVGNDKSESLIALYNFIRETYADSDIPLGYAFGGDYLYRMDDVKRDFNVGDEGYFVVPNVVRYSIVDFKFPVGFVLHSVYHDFEEMGLVSSELRRTALYITHGVPNETININDCVKEIPNLDYYIKKCLHNLNPDSVDLMKRRLYASHITRFRNQLLRDDRREKLLNLMSNKAKFYNLLSDFAVDHIKNNDFRREFLWGFVSENGVTYDLLYQYAYAEELKYLLMECANTKVNYDHFRHKIGVVGDLDEIEGYVAYIGGKTVKLVDRTSFSRRNFTKHDNK